MRLKLFTLLYSVLLSSYGSLVHAELFSTLYLNTGSGASADRTCVEELADSSGTSGSFYPNFTLHYGAGYCEDDTLFLKIECNPRYYNQHEIITSTRNICLQYVTCEEESDPPPPLYTVLPNDGSIDEQRFCEENGYSEEHTPPQYYNNTKVCWLPPCYVPPEFSPPEYTVYVLPDLTYQPDGDGDGDGILNNCDPDSDRYKEYDCDGDGEPNENDPDADNDGDGYRNGCDPAHDYFQSFDCDEDGENNWKDTDVDGDGLQNEYDNEVLKPLSPDELEGSPTCEEMQEIEEKKCMFGEHKWNCFGFPPNIALNQCNNAHTSPCEDLKASISRSCGEGYHIEDTCVDDAVTVVKGNILCVPTPDSIPNCRASDNKQLNLMEDGCECMDGYTINSFGNCWQSDLDDNATAKQILADRQKQAQQNEEIENRDKQENQLKAEANNTNNQLSSLNTQASTLAGIRKDINETNALLSRMLENGGSVASGGDGDNNDEEIEPAETTPEASDYFNKGLDALNMVKNGFNSIGNDFLNMQAKVNTGFSAIVISGDSSDVSFNFHGKNVELSTCGAFSHFSSIFYFIFSLVFLAIGLKLYFIGFTLVI